ncbi:MAG TPA: dockerin type I domain-containing protein [Candidatus Polarisedimenticolia bacterium]|jgi:hypothetical protein|nr:dockerin type I domain-containing protein [Candidatus Polarisedimenticolia bacterium]
MQSIQRQAVRTAGARLLKWIFWIAFTVLLVLFPRAASAGTIKLAWDPVGDTDLSGYRVYYGTTSRVYTNMLDVGMQTAATLNNLQDCTVYYLALKARDANGNESVAFSNEVSGMSAPEPASISPNSAVQGAGNVTVTITGNNFDTQARPDFGPGITVNSYGTTSCNRLQATISIDAAAWVNAPPAQPRAVGVLNQGGPRGQRSGAFTVLFDNKRSDIDHSGKVAARDVLYWRNAFGSILGDSSYNTAADLNGDGVVDGADLALLAVWHGTIFN